MPKTSYYDRLFSPVSTDSSSPQSEEALLPYADNNTVYPETPSLKSNPQYWHWFLHGFYLIIIVSLVAVIIASRSSQKVTPLECWERSHTFSPLNPVLASIPYTKNRFNGSLWYQSPFKGPPTAEVEAAWQSVMQYGMIAVSATDLRHAQRLEDLATAAQFPRSALPTPNSSLSGDEEKKYIAVALGTHQLHCLHFIWQDHHATFFPNSTLRKQHEVPELYERHYEHCVDYIRQSIMCGFDTSLVSYDWVREHQTPTPNSNVMHKCVNWGVVQGWLKERAVMIPDGFVWRQPEGQASLAFNP